MPVIDSSSLILLVACRATNLSKNAKLMLVLALLHKKVYVAMTAEYI